jgi:glycosyltransferase involved in cell wall biosynthesis
MKICFLTPDFYPRGGGVSHVTMDLSQELIKRGHKITIITRMLESNIKHEIHKEIEIIRIKRWLPKLVTLDYIIYSIFTFFILLRRNFDVVHAQSILPFGLITGVIEKIKKTKTIAQAHGKDINKELVLNKFTRPFAKWALKNNKIILALCNYHKKIIYNYTKKNAIILPHGQIPFEIKQTKKQCIDELKLNHSKLNILWVGRFIKRKGADILIKSIEDLNCQVHLIGEGPEKNNLYNLIKSKKMESKVTFHGVLSRDKTLKFMRASDLFVFPTKKEAFGVVILEAMEMKLPIITSNSWNTGGPTEILENNVDALLVPRDPESFKKAIIELKENNSLRTKLIKNAHRKVKKDYTWESVTDKYLNILTQVK